MKLLGSYAVKTADTAHLSQPLQRPGKHTPSPLQPCHSCEGHCHMAKGILCGEAAHKAIYVWNDKVI